MQGLQEKFLLFRVLRFRDKQAYGELYCLYAPRLRRYLIFRLPTPQDTDELLADVFLKAWDYLTTTPVESLGGLLFTIARNRTNDFYRQRGGEETLSEQQEITLEDPEIERGIQMTAEVSLLRKVIAQLPEDQQAAVLLRYFDGLSHAQVAEHLQKSVGHVRVLCHRALKTLKEHLTRV